MIAGPTLLAVLLSLQSGGAAAPKDDPARAVVELQKAIRDEPDKESHYTELGNLLLRTQNFEAAIVVLEHARPRFPQSGQLALSLGVACYGQRRFPEAVGAFLDAARLAPDAEQPIMFIARILEHATDRMEEVTERFAAFAKQNPKSALAQFALGKAKGDADALRRSIALNPNSWEAHFELGNVLDTKRDFTAAVTEFEKAVRLAPRMPSPHYRLSRLYARLGDSAKAGAERALHEKLSAEEKAEMDRRQAATRHLNLKVHP